MQIIGLSQKYLNVFIIKFIINLHTCDLDTHVMIDQLILKYRIIRFIRVSYRNVRNVKKFKLQISQFKLELKLLKETLQRYN